MIKLPFSFKQYKQVYKYKDQPFLTICAGVEPDILALGTAVSFNDPGAPLVFSVRVGPCVAGFALLAPATKKVRAHEH